MVCLAALSQGRGGRGNVLPCMSWGRFFGKCLDVLTVTRKSTVSLQKCIFGAWSRVGKAQQSLQPDRTMHPANLALGTQTPLRATSTRCAQGRGGRGHVLPWMSGGRFFGKCLDVQTVTRKSTVSLQKCIFGAWSRVGKAQQSLQPDRTMHPANLALGMQTPLRATSSRWCAWQRCPRGEGVGDMSYRACHGGDFSQNVWTF